MARARSLLVIAGALALLPVGFAAARIVRTAIVRPVLRALPSFLLEGVGESPVPPQPRLRLAGQHDVESAEADAEWHLYVIDATREEKPSSVCDIRNQARIVPLLENGVLRGIRVLSISPGSIYRRLGIENGDVIRRINGQPLDDPTKTLELYSKLRDQ